MILFRSRQLDRVEARLIKMDRQLNRLENLIVAYLQPSPNGKVKEPAE